ncbi:hypothetical protein CLU79DRAFT_820137 [Phycomyces nitens]|nr:hypothetical protein CLU79DRAFT_820137 [Phycomyces nitens]
MPRDRSNTLTSLTKRRPSYININAAATALGDDLLFPRTPKSINKSRRSSLVPEHHDTPRSPCRPTMATSMKHTPALLSDSTTAYIQEIDNHQKANGATREILTRSRSSSLTSMLVTTSSLPSFDVHTLYKIRTTRSSKKLDYFFGEQAPHDICVKEIRKEGLKAMLESKVPLCYLLYHLLEEYSSENLFFFIELEQYESFTYSSPLQQLTTAQHIYNTYLTHNSHFEVNLDDRVRRAVTTALENNEISGCFDAAKRAVYGLLESSFLRFSQSPVFDEMTENCGELTTNYDNESRDSAVKKLINYIEDQHSLIYTDPHTDTPVFMSVCQTSRRRHELIKSMIHEFCRTLVGVEFNYYRPDPSAFFQEQSRSESPTSSDIRSYKKAMGHSPKTNKDVFDFFGKKK